MAPEAEKKTVIVLGAGVIGLTTALKIQSTSRYQVEIIAEVLPTDPSNIKYTSRWAGAHYVSHSAKGTAQADIDHKTFLAFWEMSKPGGEAEHCFMRIKQTEFYASASATSDALEGMPNLCEVPPSQMFHRAQRGYSFDTVTIDVHQYINYLTARFLAKGGRITRGCVQHINEVLEGGTAPFREPNTGTERDALAASPDAIVVCTGLGARTLGGVEDRAVYPVRGQTVIVSAPWIKEGYSFEGENEWTYIIPRRNGNVVIGGTQGINDWYPEPRPETMKDILKRGLELCPYLVQPGSNGTAPVLVADEGCGLRPMRDGGPRIEVCHMSSDTKGRKIPVIFNYGHGPHGYIKSVGSAEVALDLMEEAMLGNYKETTQTPV